jgi:teichuronic acid biosynthesis glycosyltransferase TuaG
VSVSVVIATYRRREPLRAAIQSVLDQTQPVTEVLVCDDASDDGTVELVQEWAARDPRVRHVSAPGHAGRPAPARNRGIHAATGDWVAFLDDDDTWMPDKLERQLACLDAGDVDIVCANGVDTAGVPYFTDWDAPRRFGIATLRRTNPVIHSTAIARRALLLQVGGFPEEPWLAGIEDYALWLALGLAGAAFIGLPEPLVRYQRGDDDARLSTRVVTNEVAVARLLWRLSRADPGDRDLRRAALTRSSYALTIARDRAYDRLRRSSPRISR